MRGVGAFRIAIHSQIYHQTYSVIIPSTTKGSTKGALVSALRAVGEHWAVPLLFRTETLVATEARNRIFIQLPRAVTYPLSLFAKTDAVLRQRANLQMALKLRL